MEDHYCTRWTPTEGTKEQQEQEWLAKRKGLLTASDVSAALGHNKYKSVLELWEEKTGLREPEDLSEKPAVKFGKENEARIRLEFAEENKDWCDVEYHPFDILISKREPWLGATLDGEIHVTSDSNPYSAQGVEKGDEGVLEIKTGGYYSAEDLAERWTEAPLDYVEQIRTQMYCSGKVFTILKAELHYNGEPEDQGDLEGVVRREFFIKFNEQQEELIVNGCREFHQCVVENRNPSVDISDEATATDKQLAKLPATREELLEVKLEADAQIGSFIENFAEVEQAVRMMVEPYKDMVLTEKDVRDAKDIKANLNKKVKAIDEKRRSVETKYCAPLEEFKKKANALKGILTDAIKPLSAQIDYYEEQEKERKKDKIVNAVEKMAPSHFPSTQSFNHWFEHFFHPGFDSTWLNKSKSMKSIEGEIEKMMDEYVSDLDMINRHAADDVALESVMMNAFTETRSISAAFKAEDNFREAEALRAEREAQRKAREEEAEQRRKAAEERRRAAEQAAPFNAAKPIENVSKPVENVTNTVENAADSTGNVAKPVESVPEQPAPVSEKPMIVFTFKAAHTSVAEWKNLINYMKEHGFKYTQVK